MDETALRSSITGFEQQLSSLEWKLYAWTLLVIVGCAGELYFVLRTYLEDKALWRRSRNRGAIQFPEKPPVLVLIFELLSVAFVVFGISGELQVDRKSGDIQTKLRDANSELVLLLEGQTLSASKAAGDAKGSADGAAEAAAIAREDAEKLLLEVIKQGPRTIPLRRYREDLIKKLRPFAGQRFTLVEEVGRDTEATGALVSIKFALDGARWINNLQMYFSPANTNGEGVIIRILPNASEKTRRSAKALSAALNDVLLTGVWFDDHGDETRRTLSSSLPFDEQTVLVEVGEHPIPR
jgi:hypothetical protein